MKDDLYRKSKLHNILFGAILILSLLKILIWFAPTTFLHEYGLDHSIDLEFSLGFWAALVIAIVSFIFRKSAPSLIIYYTTQVLAWGNSILLFALFILRGLYVAMNGGV